MLARRGPNLQVAARALNPPPAASPGGFTLSMPTFARLRDVARIERGAQYYTLNAYLDNKNATALGIFQRPGSNAIATSNQIKATMERLKKEFPPGTEYSG